MKLSLTIVASEDKDEYLPLLLIADESEKAVKQYFADGDLFSIHINDELSGVILFTTIDVSTIELKNFALLKAYRGKGLGKKVIQTALSDYKEMGVKQVLVGTANSSIGNIAFYQKAGFRMKEIKRDFFLDYPEPIIENGIRALDMLMFQKELD
ncbi:GNAT family N-acetyltransferase [Bacillus salacetis]|uniref:GNAT family N-acetyltransferase n=1 Tax=Bacillus salacetis TaxID=2315464 RepID=A0A3A1R3Z9_9BACI|nr:GNAT family N-acetyltransferase [Bacillus salacetis]RIW37264.1 GNAT family N-acetyltransferase [Bacillus salacetis]